MVLLASSLGGSGSGLWRCILGSSSSSSSLNSLGGGLGWLGVDLSEFFHGFGFSLGKCLSLGGNSHDSKKSKVLHDL